MSGAIFSIPNLGEIDTAFKDAGAGAGKFIASDFALATGLEYTHVNSNQLMADEQRHVVSDTWLAHAVEGGSYVLVRRGFDRYEGAGARPTIGVKGALAIIRNARAGGYDVQRPRTALFGDPGWLTLNGKIVLYPQIKATDEMERELESFKHNGAAIPHAVGDVPPERNVTTTICPTEQITPTEYGSDVPKEHKWYYYKDAWYVNVEDTYGHGKFNYGAEFNDGESHWFECRPISARFNDTDTDICFQSVLAACAFEPDEPNRIRDLANGMYKFDLAASEFHVGKFLNGAFKANIERTTHLVDYYNDAVRIGKPESVDNKFGTIKRGSKLVIKCEGREGVLKSYDAASGLATLAVDGKTLKYRAADLEVSE